MRSILILTFSSIDNDSRVLKEIYSYKKNSFNVTSLSINTKNKFCFESFSIKHRNNRIFIPGLSYFILSIKFIHKILSLSKYNYLHANDLSTLPFAVLYKLFNPSTILIYDSHEYAINDIPYQSFLSIKTKYIKEWFFIRFTNHVITVSNSISNEYSRLYKNVKSRVVLNCPNFIEYKKHDIFRDNFSIGSNQKIFLYQGGLSKGRGLEILLDAFSKFNSKDNVLVCMGYGPLETLIKQHAQKYPNIFFQPAVPPDLLLRYTSSADFGISFIEDLCLSYRYCLPNKMFEYLMAGLPIITSNLYEMKHLVETEGLGIVTKENTVLGFKNAIKSILNENYLKLQQNVFSVRNKYCWENQEKILLKIF